MLLIHIYSTQITTLCSHRPKCFWWIKIHPDLKFTVYTQQKRQKTSRNCASTADQQEATDPDSREVFSAFEKITRIKLAPNTHIETAVFTGLTRGENITALKRKRRKSSPENGFVCLFLLSLQSRDAPQLQVSPPTTPRGAPSKNKRNSISFSGCRPLPDHKRIIIFQFSTKIGVFWSIYASQRLLTLFLV